MGLEEECFVSFLFSQLWSVYCRKDFIQYGIFLGFEEVFPFEANEISINLQLGKNLE